MRVLVAVASVVAGCATAATPRATTAELSPALQERAAALFEAASHGDEPRLKAMIDWPRWRTVDGLVRAGSDEQAAEVLSRIEAEPSPSAAFVDASVHAVRARLAEAASGPTPPQPRTGSMNATVASWRQPPGAGTPPSLARLRTLVAESLEGTQELTYEGARRVTLLFAGNLLVGVVDAR